MTITATITDADVQSYDPRAIAPIHPLTRAIARACGRPAAEFDCGWDDQRMYVEHVSDHSRVDLPESIRPITQWCAGDEVRSWLAVTLPVEFRIDVPDGWRG